MTSKQLINHLLYECITKNCNEGRLSALQQIKNDLEVLEQFKTLKNYYPPFKDFLEEMFKKGDNTDLTEIKEWLEK